MRLVLEDIHKCFGEKEVLKGASFTFETGNLYGLLGRNGAGKTTLFNCINEDVPVDKGGIFIETGGLRRKPMPEDIGYVLATPVVPEFLTGREFLKFFMDINRGKIGAERPLDEFFDIFRIAPEDRDRLIKDYSHGMKNKMQMIVNFIAEPGILLLDEPLTSFDVVVADEMKQLLRGMKQRHIIIFSTHIMELALDLCDEIVILNGGVLESIEGADLDKAAFKDRIIMALKGGEDA